MKISDLGVLTLCSIHYASDARVSQVIGRLHTDSGFIIVYELLELGTALLLPKTRK